MFSSTMHQKYIVAMPNTFLVIKPKMLFFNNNNFPIIIVIIYIFYVVCSEAFFLQLSFSQEFTKMRGFILPCFLLLIKGEMRERK